MCCVDEDKHCSMCVWYLGIPPYMWCKRLNRRITARKRPCRYYENYAMKKFNRTLGTVIGVRIESNPELDK